MQKLKKMLLKIKYLFIDAFNLIKRCLKSKTFFYIEDIITLIFALCGIILLDDYIPFNVFGIIIAIFLLIIIADIIINIFNDLNELFKKIFGSIIVKKKNKDVKK